MSNIVSELDHLFYPKNVAIFGASNKIKIGTMGILTLIAGGFKGEIYPIHPREDNIMGLTAYHKLREAPKGVDLAIISVPAKNVPEVIEECVDAGVGACVIFSSNFSEVGEEGKRLEEEVLRIARRGKIRFVGPNCMGITNMDTNLCALMNFSIPKRGNVSVVSQSGTLGTLSMLNASAKSVGFNKFVSSGNEADLRMEDFIEYLSQDEGTDVIFAFIEGVRGGRRFLDVSKEATRKKPFIVLKGGVTSSGSRAARSHTGSMAGSDEIYDAIFRQSGIARASDESDMIDLIKGFSKSPLPKGRRVAIYTVGGGFGILAADECEKNGLDVIKLPEDIIEELNHFLPPFWSHRNPIDVTASGAAALGGDGSIDERSLKILLESPAIDGIIFMAPTNITSRINRVMPRISVGDIKEMLSTIIETGMLGGASKDQAEKIIELKERYDKPMVGVNPWGESEIEEYRILEEGGIPLYRSTTQAARVLSKLIEYKEYLDKQKFLSDTKV